MENINPRTISEEEKAYYFNKLIEKVAYHFKPDGNSLDTYTAEDYRGLIADIEIQLKLEKGPSKSTFERYTNKRTRARVIPSSGILKKLCSYIYGYDTVDINAWHRFINDPKNQPTKEVEERREEEKIDEPIIIQDMYDQKALMDLVVKGELEEVLNFLLQKPSSPKQQIEIAELASQLKELKRDMRVNIITREENSRRMSRIRMSVLEFIQELAR